MIKIVPTINEERSMRFDFVTKYASVGYAKCPEGNAPNAKTVSSPIGARPLYESGNPRGVKTISPALIIWKKLISKIV